MGAILVCATRSARAKAPEGAVAIEVVGEGRNLEEQQEDGSWRLVCTSPCSLRVARGTALRTSDASGEAVTIVDERTPERVRLEPEPRPSRAVPIGLIAAGTALTLAGIVWAVTTTIPSIPSCGDRYASDDPSCHSTVPIAMMAVGIALAVFGYVLLQTNGARQSPSSSRLLLPLTF